jgi:hypothetical protein
MIHGGPSTCVPPRITTMVVLMSFATGMILPAITGKPLLRTPREMTMNGIMNGNGSMMWGMGSWGILILVLVVLGVAALAKYLFSNNKR